MIEKPLFSGTEDYLYSYRVLAVEEVKVKAGTFKAFKMEVVQKAGYASAVTHIWFSPEVKNLIKTKFIGSYTGDWNIKGQDFELADFRLARPSK